MGGGGGRRPRRSQALLGQGGGHLVGQRGQLGGVGHVDAARGRDGAQLLRGVFQRDDLGAVVSARLGHLAEVQLVALNLRRKGGGVRSWRKGMHGALRHAGKKIILMT